MLLIILHIPMLNDDDMSRSPRTIHPASPGLLRPSEASQHLETSGGPQRRSMLVRQHHALPEVRDGGEAAHALDVLSLVGVGRLVGWGWEVGRLGGWEVGRLGGWEVGRLGGWEVGRLGGWGMGWGNHWAKWSEGVTDTWILVLGVLCAFW